MSKKLSIEEIQQRIKDRFPEETFQIIKYDGMGVPGEIYCCKCKNIIKVNKFSNFFAKNKVFGCKNCHGLWRDREIKIAKIKEKYNILYTYVNQKDTHTYYCIKCKRCGHERKGSLSNFIKNLDCGCMTNVYSYLSRNDFIQILNRVYDNELELISNYINQTTKVLVRHLPCKFIWEANPIELVHARVQCPKCKTKQSKGEKEIVQILTKYNINYEYQKQLKNSKQRFDFYLPEYNLAIEYNGRQHYEFIPYFHKTEEGFLTYQERDQRKRDYCGDNNIQLLEISYEEKDLEKIILNKISSTTKVEQAFEKATFPKIRKKI